MFIVDSFVAFIGTVFALALAAIVAFICLAAVAIVAKGAWTFASLMFGLFSIILDQSQKEFK